MTGCWLVEQGLVESPCMGRLIRAHLIPKQLVKRELRESVREGLRRGAGGRKVSKTQMNAALERVVWDPRVIVPVCGGVMGNGGHHGLLDSGGVNKIVVPRALIPGGVEAFAEEWAIGWWLDRTYGLKEN